MKKNVKQILCLMLTLCLMLPVLILPASASELETIAAMQRLMTKLPFMRAPLRFTMRLLS